MDIVKRIQTLDVGTILFFFKLDLSSWGIDQPLLFHCNGATEVLNEAANRYELDTDMMYRGELYTFAGVSMEGIALSNDGKVNQPTLKVANYLQGQKGALSVLCRMYDNLIGAKLEIMITTLEAYEIGDNQEFKQVWWVERKSSEDESMIEFELTSPLDFKGQQVPTRLVIDVCQWAMRGQYRGESCGYTGTRYFDKKGNPVDSITLDACGGSCNDCIIRFGEGVPLPFGGFLIAMRTNF